MPKLAIFFAASFLVIFLLQENSYGFIEGFDAPPLPNFDIKKSPEIISIDVSPQQDLVKRYLVYGQGQLNTAYLEPKNLVYGIDSASGFFSVGIFNEDEVYSIKSKGYTVIEDFLLDFNSEYVKQNFVTGVSQFENIANSRHVHDLYNVTGKGVTVAIMDTGVDFSNPDIMESLARDEFNKPIMLDADGQGLVLTNSTYVAKIDNLGRIQNLTKGEQWPENAVSSVYVSKDGVFLKNSAANNGTNISVYNSLYPFYGSTPVISGKIIDDMKIGNDKDDFIISKSGIYHLGVILSPHAGSLQVVPVLVTDSKRAGVYDTITPDMSTSWLDFFRTEDKRPDYDFDFTDETPITIGGGNEFLVYDSDYNDMDDYSAGTVGARVVDVHGIFSGEADIDDHLGAVNGTLLPAMDDEGKFFGVMTDFFGHGTASASTIASKGIMEYDIYNDTKKYTIKGIAPDVSILPVKTLWFGDIFYAWMWSAGFENNENKWIYSGKPRADIISNSWGISHFLSLEFAPGLDIVSHIQNTLVIPQSLHANYTGITMVSAAGNSGHGYGTMGSPGLSSYGISVGAVTNNDFVGYGPFKDQPRFGNTTDHSNHVVDFSSRGPGLVGDPKPDLMSIGAYAFVPGIMTKEPDSSEEQFRLFGGTSMSAPIVAGSAALLTESLKEKSIDYDPFTIRNILMSTANDLHNDPFTQGAGLVNALDAVRAVNGHYGKFVVYNDESFSNIKEIINTPLSSFNSDPLGIEQFSFSDKTYPMTSWYGGMLHSGETTSTAFVIENPTNNTLDVSIKPVTLKLIDKLQIDQTTKPHLQDPILNQSETYRPNYVKLSSLTSEHTSSSQDDIIPTDSSLMVLNLNFPFDTFMNQTDTTYADDLKISSLYIYDWKDKNNDYEISSDEISLVTRGGSWGTVQEIRISDPAEKFKNEPVVGVYPVPEKYSFWRGSTNQNSTSMDYTLSASYYKKDLWTDISIDTQKITIPPNNSTKVSVTLTVPPERQTGVYQGFLSFEAEHHKVNSPISYVVVQPVDKKTKQVVIYGSEGEALYGNGYVKGAFDMTNRYMAGDWRQYYFDIQDRTINAAAIDFEWENDNTNFTVFMADPQGKIIQTNFPSGIFGEFLGWQTSDWLGNSPFSQGGAFYPVKNKDNTSTVLYAPINQTGTYTLFVHSTLFDGKSITEPISLAAKFTTIVPDNKPPEIIFDLPELINSSFEISPQIVEKNLDFVKYYLDGQEVEFNALQTKLLPDGQHNLQVYARDIVENEVEKTFLFTVDSTPPEIVVKSPKNNTTVSHSLEIDFKVEDRNLADKGAVSILLPWGETLDDVTYYLYNATQIDEGTYNLKILATDLAENEQIKTITFNVDYSFVQQPSGQQTSVQQPSVIPMDEKPTTQITILLVVSIIITAAVVFTIYVRKTRKISTKIKS